MYNIRSNTKHSYNFQSTDSLANLKHQTLETIKTPTLSIQQNNHDTKRCTTTKEQQKTEKKISTRDRGGQD